MPETTRNGPESAQERLAVVDHPHATPVGMERDWDEFWASLDCDCALCVETEQPILSPQVRCVDMKQEKT